MNAIQAELEQKERDLSVLVEKKKSMLKEKKQKQDDAKKLEKNIAFYKAKVERTPSLKSFIDADKIKLREKNKDVSRLDQSLKSIDQQIKDASSAVKLLEKDVEDLH